jgi:hypothetical protein
VALLLPGISYREPSRIMVGVAIQYARNVLRRRWVSRRLKDNDIAFNVLSTFLAEYRPRSAHLDQAA